MLDLDIEFLSRVDLKSEIKKLRNAIRNHRDQKGDDRCWMDDSNLYSILPEKYTPIEKDSCVLLEYCKQYIAARQDPRIQYVSPQRRIEELEDEIKALKFQNNMLRMDLES